MAQNYLFIIGAPKCGTTSFADMLDQYRNVAVAAGKEPRFFTDYGTINWTGPAGDAFRQTLVTDAAAYEAEFAHRPDALWRVDASTDYLSCAASAGMIAGFAARPDVGEVLIAVILRDPVARIISEYAHTLRDGFETETLRRAVELEPTRIAAHWHPLFHHLRRSHYADAVAAYRARFGDRLMILDYHALEDGFARLTAAMGLAESDREAGSEAGMSHANQSYTPKSMIVQRLWRAPALLRVVRRIVPKALRSRVRRGIEAMNAADTRPDPADIAFLRDRLADEIRACTEDPDIPTGSWSLARG